MLTIERRWHIGAGRRVCEEDSFKTNSNGRTIETNAEYERKKALAKASKIEIPGIPRLFDSEIEIPGIPRDFKSQGYVV
eukprot:scaffold2413_cov90-Skeletonema_dohrnii-CCMP3373.AAC.3